MASALSADRIQQINFGFTNRMVNPQGVAARICPIIMAPGVQTFEVGGAAVGGIGSTLSRTATDVALADYFSKKASYSMVQKVFKSRVPFRTLNTDYAFQNAGAALADTAIATMDKGLQDALSGLFTSAHPRAGTDAGQVGATKKYLDTALKYLNGESGEGTQDNLLTSGLDYTSLNAAIKLLTAQRNDRGIPLGIGSNGGLFLVIGNKNQQVAHEMTNSAYTSNLLQANFAGGLISDVVVAPFLADDDDWFLIAKDRSPVGLAIGSDPEARVSLTTDGLFVELVAEVTYTVWANPYGEGIVGSNVA